MVGIAGVDVVPDVLHVINFGLVVEFAQESFFEFFWNRAGNNAGNVHVWVANAGKTEVDDADDFVVFVEQDVAEIEVAMYKVVLLGVFDIFVIGWEMVFVVLIIKFF